MLREENKMAHMNLETGVITRYDRTKKGTPEKQRLVVQLQSKHNVLNFLLRQNIDDKHTARIQTLTDEINSIKAQIDIENKHAPQHKGLRRSIKKRSLDQIKASVLGLIKNNPDRTSLTKEDVARTLCVKECQVEQVFAILNREGVLSQARHHAPHDNQREPWSGFLGTMGWCGDSYKIL